jgi:4-aminobutyrate aminotransferase-like enzyme
MKRDEINRKHKQYLFPAVANYYSDPLPLASGSMQHVWDVEGRRYLDFFGGIVTVGLGHANPRVNERIKKQIDTLQHVSSLFPTEPLVTLAEKIAQITPGRQLTKSFFTNSGTEADETAVHAARMHTGNFEIVALRHGYSGRSSLARGLNGMNTWRRATLAVGVVHAVNPYCYRCPLKLTYPGCDLACARDLEQTIQTSTSGRIAGLLAEPIQGVAGFITPPKEYFKIAFDIVKQYGGDFIADEVQTGWGRTGHKWFGIEHWEVVPDIITAAKTLGNGVPIGLTVARPEVADAYQGLTISTFGGNPVTCAAANAVIDVIEEDDLRTNAAVVGAYFRQGLEALREEFELIGDVRGMGLMQGLELVTDRASKQPAAAATNALLEAARDRGLLIGKGGMYGNVVRMSPPLNIGKADVDEAVKILRESFRAVSSRQPAGTLA